MHTSHTRVAQHGKYNVIVVILYCKMKLHQICKQDIHTYRSMISLNSNQFTKIKIQSKQPENTGYKMLFYTSKCKGGKSSLKSYRENPTDLHWKQPNFYQLYKQLRTNTYNTYLAFFLFPTITPLAVIFIIRSIQLPQDFLSFECIQRNCLFLKTWHTDL